MVSGCQLVLPLVGSWQQTGGKKTETGQLYDLWVNCSVIAHWAGSTWWGGGSLEKELEAPGRAQQVQRKLMTVESEMLSNHLILCHLLSFCLQPFPESV